jgi:hypothetical protein
MMNTRTMMLVSEQRSGVMWSRRLVLLILWLGAVGGCGELRMPKREPLSVRGGGSELEADLSISTNCIEVGEPLTITLRLTNRSPEPYLLRGEPPVDITIEQKDRSRIDYWSATPDYPQSFDPTIPAGTSRDYQWSWVAPADFAENLNVRSGATIRYVTAQFPRGGALLNLGVHWYTDGEYVVTCDEMR